MKPSRFAPLRRAAVALALLLALPVAGLAASAPAPKDAPQQTAKEDGKGAGKGADKGAAKTAPAEASKPPPAEEAPPSYEPRLLRLAEILGALAYLQDLCNGPDAQSASHASHGQANPGQIWRSQMAALMEAEGRTQLIKQRLAGAYNRGFRGYETSYRRCTPNAQAIIARFLDESGRLAHEIAQRGAS
jgi:uncharacterized protein (TIGR02301 family)